MITLQAITGLLIAAVLNVLGTGQREVAKVENEPVVKTESKAPVTFYHIGNGVYSPNQPNGTNCQPVDPRPCTIIYLNEEDVEGVEEFELDSPSQPDGEHENSAANGIWQ